MTLERASIDEFFIDVTSVVESDDDVTPWPDESESSNPLLLLREAQEATVVVGNDDNNNNNNADTADQNEATTQQPQQQQQPVNDDDDDEEEDDDLLYWKGAVLALRLRRYVYDTLGFTISAGVSTNKTTAKLSASYGKPDGQAVTLPRHVPYLMDRTPVAECRNLGGKLGQSVADLLRAEGLESTVGNIRRHLSLPALRDALPDATAVWVHDLARGIDTEAVTPRNLRDGGLTKSITAFKSFPGGRQGGLTLTEAADWIRLLAREIVGRVRSDGRRNRRHPRTCTVQYALPPGRRSHHNRSVRIAYPPGDASVEAQIAELVARVPAAVTAREGPGRRFSRVGLCATDFVGRQAGQRGMEAFLHKVQSSSTTTTSGTSRDVDSPKDAAASPTRTTRQPFSSPVVVRGEVSTASSTATVSSHVATTAAHAATRADADLALARKLQATYDREHGAWRNLDRKRKRQQKATAAGHTPKISSFFGKKDK